MTKAQAEVSEVFKESKIMEQTDIQKLKYLKLIVKESELLGRKKISMDTTSLQKR